MHFLLEMKLRARKGKPMGMVVWKAKGCWDRVTSEKVAWDVKGERYKMARG